MNIYTYTHKQHLSPTVANLDYSLFLFGFLVGPAQLRISILVLLVLVPCGRVALPV